MEKIMEEIKEKKKQKYVTFMSGKEYFGLKIEYVNEIIVAQEITSIPETEDYIKGLINLRGKIIPVIDVRLRFKQEPFEYDDRTCIIVITHIILLSIHILQMYLVNIEYNIHNYNL